MHAQHHSFFEKLCCLSDMQADSEFERERCNRLLEQQADARQQVCCCAVESRTEYLGSGDCLTEARPLAGTSFYLIQCIWPRIRTVSSTAKAFYIPPGMSRFQTCTATCAG